MTGPIARWFALLAIAAALVAAPQVAEADRTVTVLFTGLGAAPGNAGMDDLDATLASVFGGNPAQPFSSQVFPYTDQQEAFDFIDGFTDLGCLVLIGHSFGADSATGVFVPEGVDGGQLVKSIRDDFGVTLAGGQDQWKGKIVRIAHLGYVDTFDVIVALSALELALKKFGAEIEFGKGLV